MYFLAEQMGTSVNMIENHYGHVNTIKHADRVLQGMTDWEVPHLDDAKARTWKAAETHDVETRSEQQAALPLNLPKPSLPEPLAEAGKGDIVLASGPDALSEMVLICRCPAGALLIGKSRCTSRRWRLYFVQFLLAL